MSSFLGRVISSAAQPIAVSRRRADSMPLQIAGRSFEPVGDPRFESRQEFDADPTPVQNPLAELPPPNTGMGLPGSDTSLAFQLWNRRTAAAIRSTSLRGWLQHDRPTENGSNAAVESALAAGDRPISTSRIQTGPNPADPRLQPLEPRTKPTAAQAASAAQGLLANAGIRVAPPTQPHAMSWQIRALQRHLGFDDIVQGNVPNSATTESESPAQVHTPLINRTAEPENLHIPPCSDQSAGVVPPNASAFSGPELVIKNLEVRVVPPTPKPSPPSPAPEPRVERGRLGAWVSPARCYLGRD
jgi:hypothetical protein